MKKLFTILGIICAITAVILAVLPLFKLAFIPALIAFILGVFAFIKAKTENQSKTHIQLIFVITILALVLSIYKSVTITPEVGNTEQFEEREKTSEENAIKELEGIDITE